MDARWPSGVKQRGTTHFHVVFRRPMSMKRVTIELPNPVSLSIRPHAWVVVVVGCLMARSAVAQSQPAAAPVNVTDAQKQKDAVAIFKEGKVAFEAGRFLVAVEKWTLADALVPGAAPRFWLGQAHEKMGHVVDAARVYTAFLELNPPPLSAYGKRIPEVQARLKALAPRMPALVTFTVTPSIPEPALVVDGALGQRSPLSLTPGQHTVVITSQGFRPHTETLLVTGNEKRSLDVLLQPEVVRVAPLPMGPPSEQTFTLGTGTVVCYGLATVTAVVGGVFGGLAMKERARFYDLPTVEAADSTERNARIADLAFGVAVATAVGGTVLGFVVKNEPYQAATRRVPAVRPWAGSKGAGAFVDWTF